MSRSLVPFVLSVLLMLSVPCFATITIPTVPVGDPGNAGELSGPGAGQTGAGYDRVCGSVGYAYNIGKYEVTAAQYTDFLNKVAATDTYGLYSTSMWSSSYASKIQRSGSPGSYTYSVAVDWADRPVNFVSYWDSCRFANWLHNGQPTGLQNASTTEDGAYFINGYNSDDGRTIQRKAGWKWAVTSEDEWYKAAWYKGGSTNAGYWDYPTSSDTAPGRDMADASGNNANWYTGSGTYPIDSPHYTTIAGEFQNSDSPYGTFDQGGNVREWNEAIPGQLDGYQWRGLRGGAFNLGNSLSIQALFRSRGNPATFESESIGFRVVAVPEPSSLAMLAGGLISLLGLRKRRA